ncbi:DUF3754 domain-containing protein [Fimbriiglobus ruber]|uniref:DUF3754 domain-containing protein n=1 Tax=Fimbriiglobus ruber TaxID=1908690 RepID=A0A225DCI5_9BACT|nr:DUF3754 domain-containing protein [Fimbriiglobus ruber]OWK35026.1 hypothetical protein FRUB_09868 [Fimbriiglobus ruber]
MAIHPDREHFIPLRASDLVDALCTRAGPADGQHLNLVDQNEFRRFARAAAAHVHAQYRDNLDRLKTAYAPFDPDTDLKTVAPPTDAARDAALDGLFDGIAHLLEKANYTQMTREEFVSVMEGASDWGVDMDVAWAAFDRLEVFVRGIGHTRRFRRKWYRLWRREEIAVPTFRRVLVAVKQRPHPRLGVGADTRSVFLKLFKDIPRMDVEMLLPATRVKMPKFDRVKLGGSISSSVGYGVYKLSTLSFDAMMAALSGAAGVLGVMTLATPIAVLLGYGYSTYASFVTQKQTYLYNLAQSLYYQNLDNNAGVIYRMLDEAEEQELREILLAYFYLWRFAGDGGWTAAELDDYVELDLERLLETEVDFEIEDALGKLVALGLVTQDGDRYAALPVAAARDRFAALWGRLGAADESAVCELVG